MAVVTQRVAVQRVMARGLPSIVARSVSVAPKWQQQRWRSARRVVAQAAVRSVTSGNSVIGPLGLANAGVWGRFAGLRAERVVVRKAEIAKPKQTYQTVASAALLDERINQGEFTEMAWQAIVASPDVAKESKQQIVETEHLMKALLEQHNGLARRIFAKAGVDNTSLLQATERFVQRQPKVMGDTSGSMLGRDLEGLIDKARGHKKEYGDSFVSVEHLVLAYAQDKRFGQQLFKDFQLSAKALNAAIQSVREPATLPEPGPQWDILERWNVPWDSTTTVAGILSWLASFVLTGLIVSLATAQFGRRQDLDLDEQATFILFYQLAQTITGLGALSLVLGRYKPLPTELFSYEIRAPFDLRRGWILYGGLGLAGATASVLAASTLVVELSGQQPPRENADALLQLLPIIGASPASTASLVFVTGVLAPLLEETVFRGFVLTSLTKWVPTPVAIVVSACAFAGAHLTPGEFPQLLALGIVLGLAYAQTRTLATPILIHSLWNSGVIILLTILRLQGFDIKELL